MKLLDVKEIAQILNVKPSTIYQWSELGQMPCIKFNGCVRFDFDDVTNWLNSCKKEVNSGYNPFIQIRGPKKGGKI